MSAKDRKKKVDQGITKEQASSRRAGRMQIHRVQPKPALAGQKKQDVAENARKARQVPMSKPQGLSAEARFMELKPDGCHVLDWWRLFTSDETKWDAIVLEWYKSVITEEV